MLQTSVVLAFGFRRLRLTCPHQHGFRRNSRAENSRHVVRRRKRKLAVVCMPLSLDEECLVSRVQTKPSGKVPDPKVAMKNINALTPVNLIPGMPNPADLGLQRCRALAYAVDFFARLAAWPSSCAGHQNPHWKGPRLWHSPTGTMRPEDSSLFATLYPNFRPPGAITGPTRKQRRTRKRFTQGKRFTQAYT